MNEVDYSTNVGAWDLSDLKLRISAVHTPDLDELMMAFRRAQRAVADDEPRLAKHIKPYLGDMAHTALRNHLNRTMQAVIDYVLNNPEVLVIQRRLK